MFKRIFTAVWAASLLLALGGCKEAPFDAGVLQSFEGLKQAHLALIDTCSVMPALDAAGLEAKRDAWQKISREADGYQGGLMENDDLRKAAFKILKDHFEMNLMELQNARYPLSPTFVSNLREQAINDHNAAIAGEKARKNSPYHDANRKGQ
ncbi:hypothetical protein HZA73_03750 [candidate division TA06 bacterium]|nr:hypothetical protein [candidate division TA06 bacterium]